MKKLHLEIKENNKEYPIYIGANLLKSYDLFAQVFNKKEIAIVSNTTVAPLFMPDLECFLAQENKRFFSVLLPDGERYKNLASYEKILEALLNHRLSRDGLLLALGGGVIGDMAGFAAASYQRGIDFVQIPTTLLAQVDSSVGGKTGINHPLGKNMIGAFHQPKAVLIDTSTLERLPEREFSAGLAEVIKYGLINDLPFFAYLEENIEKIMMRNQEVLEEVIAHCCKAKADIVARDEKEAGVRALLNLGHTFGHALESLTHYEYYKHGEAIAVGMMMAAHLAKLEGKLKSADLLRIEALLQKANLPTTMQAPLSAEAIYQAMFLDKKVRSGKLRLITIEALGKTMVRSDVAEDLILRAISSVILGA